MIQPLGNKVLVVQVKKEIQDTGAVALPDSYTDKLRYATVVDVGSKVEEVTNKDTILLPKGDLIEIPYKGTTYNILTEDEIVAIV